MRRLTAKTTLKPHPGFPRFFTSALLVLFLLPLGAQGWLPGTSDPQAADGFVVDTSNRNVVVSFFNTVYRASENYASHIEWTGDVQSGDPGTTSHVFKEDVRRRINFYRALVGLPADIIFDETSSQKSQEAALMMAANGQLSHFPTPDWTHYTEDGAEGAARSNLYLGRYGPPAIDGYILDPGENNKPVGHRRWILYSRARVMGTGDIPPGGSSHLSSNANWVIGNFNPAPPPRFVAWPNEGYSPQPIVPERWSLSYPGASFASASVVMTHNGQEIPVDIVSNTDTGMGDNTLVWEPASLPGSAGEDREFTITVSGMSGAGVPASHTYSVHLFDPNILTDEVVISGPASPSVSGATYSFNSIDQADAYELRVSLGSHASWTEGAEDAPTPRILDKTSSAYPLRQGDVKRTGNKAFHLTFPAFTNQEFRVDREIIPSSQSRLVFHDLGRFATTTTTLSAEVSANDGASWIEIWSRPGVGNNSSLWDSTFQARSLDLSPFQGQKILIRFKLRYNGGSAFVNTSTNHGFFIDDISVTHAVELVGTHVTQLPADAESFDLNAHTAGAPLAEGTPYFLRIRPNLGTRWFSDGPLKTIETSVQVQPDPPEVTQHPTSRSVVAPEGTEFSVTVGGTQPFSFQWEISEDGGSTWTELDGEKDASFSTGNTELAMQGNLYRVRVNNEAGETTSNPAELTVLPPPVGLENLALAGGEETVVYLTDFPDTDWRVRFTTNKGHFVVDLRNDAAPLTVRNFLRYVTAGDYDESFVHRSVPGFVIQGGGYTLVGEGEEYQAFQITSHGSLPGEFSLSNVRGTMSMALMGGDPDSGTSQWFVNVADNLGLDEPENGPFTVFGVIDEEGMAVVDAINNLPRVNFSQLFSEVPLLQFTQGVPVVFEDFVTIPTVELVNPPQVVEVSRPDLMKVDLVGDRLVVQALGGTSGEGRVTLGFFANGSWREESFQVTTEFTAAILEIEETSREYEKEAVEEGMLEVTSNTQWTATTNSPWVTLLQSSGTFDGSVSYQLTANASEGERAGVITVAGGGIERTLTIRQRGSSAGPTAPEITTHPDSQSVEVGDSASFSVSATGSFPLAYQWQISTNDGTTWSNIVGATASDYNTGATTAAMDGHRYRVVVSNSAGSVTSSPATLGVLPEETGSPSFAGAHDAGNHLKYLDWFGWYNDEHWPWIWDYEHDCWLWVVDNGPENLWFWHDNLQNWMWTRPDWYRWVWFPDDPGLTWRSE